MVHYVGHLAPWSHPLTTLQFDYINFYQVNLYLCCFILMAAFCVGCCYGPAMVIVVHHKCCCFSLGFGIQGIQGIWFCGVVFRRRCLRFFGNGFLSLSGQVPLHCCRMTFVSINTKQRRWLIHKNNRTIE